jgi:plasmid stability protein
MAKTIQLRNVPDTLHRKLKARAVLEGMSLSEYLMSEIRHMAERPTMDELRARLQKRVPVELNGFVTKAIRAQRESR